MFVCVSVTVGMCRYVCMCMCICVYVGVMCIVCWVCVHVHVCLFYCFIFHPACLFLSTCHHRSKACSEHFNYPIGLDKKSKHFNVKNKTLVCICGWTNWTIHNTVYANFVRENLGKFEFCGKIRRRHFSLLIVSYLHTKFQKNSWSGFPGIASLTD